MKLPSFHGNIMNGHATAAQTEFFKRERHQFKKEVSDHYWKKYWVIAMLKAIHKIKGLEPAIHPFLSIQ